MTTISADSIAAPRASKSRIPLGAVDGRSRIGRRIAELREIFTAAVIEAYGNPVTALMLSRIETAAVMAACAAAGRERFLRGQLSPDDLVRLENRAARAERALGLGQEKTAKPKITAPTLTEMLSR